MGKLPDLPTEILKQIRDELRGTNSRLDQTNLRLDQVVHEQIRQTTAIIGLEQSQRALTAGLDALKGGMDAVVRELKTVNVRLGNVIIR